MGSAGAETFAGLGARVFGCDLSAVELAETARTGVKTAVLDLTDRAAAAAWIMEIGQTVDSPTVVPSDPARRLRLGLPFGATPGGSGKRGDWQAGRPLSP